jgi:hypothetical protein
MADITLTIPLPVLIAGQHFKTRYRELPSGSWSGYTNRTNAPFTITGLTAGNYQLEVILVKADETECPAVYKTFIVTDDYDCIDFTAEIVQNGSLYNLVISYTLPGGFADPGCGWDIIILQSGNTTTIPYATLSVSGTITIPVSNTVLNLKIRANQCNGNYKYCFDGEVPAAEPDCTPMSAISGTILYTAGATFPWSIKLDFTNSTPPTTFANIHYSQTGFIMPGNIPDSGNLIFPFMSWGAGPTSVTFKVLPAPYEGELSYAGTILDVCGVVHQWST